MQIEKRPGETSLAQKTVSAIPAPSTNAEGVPAAQHPSITAKLPIDSQAAVAQRLNDIPLQAVPGYYYAVAHRRSHPIGWRTKRYVKRKHLRHSNQRYAATDRIGTRTMLPMAFSAFGIFLATMVIFVTLASFVQATQRRYGQDVTTLQDIIPQDSLRMYDANGQLIYQATDQGLQTSEPLNKISPWLADAEIAIEDQTFWQNPGYDITGIVRATIEDLTNHGVVSGGSTITQQLIKNAIVGNRTTVVRKLEEISLAPSVTRYYTKQQILDMYLNTTYYGEQSYGAEAAALAYFNLKDTPKQTAAQQLDLAQAAMLAGIPSSPIARDPYLFPKAALNRVQHVLQEMYIQGYISAQQKQAALNEVQRPGFLHHGYITNAPAFQFTTYALGELAQDLHVRTTDLSRSGVIVSTTLNLNLQKKILKDAQTHIAEMARAHNMTNAAVSVINYHNGDILAIVGNIDPHNPVNGQFNVATEGYRQPGSSFKPFIYATAFAQGMSPGQPVVDGPLVVRLCCGLPPYTPTNYDMQYHGLVTYRYALQNSFNIPAVKVLLKTGVEPALHTAQIMGIRSYNGIPNYTMVLGSLGVHLLDETSAYGAFGNGGVRVQDHAINTVMNTRGRIIYTFQPVGTQVISKQVAFIMTNVLSDNNARTYEFGKCSSLFLYTNSMNQCYSGKPGPIRPSAAKTGTSTDFRDNWTVGYTTDYVVGVWAGNNDNTPMVDVTGVDGAGPIWHDTMLMVEQGHPISNFAPPPSGVVQKTVHYPGITSTDWYLTK